MTKIKIIKTIELDCNTEADVYENGDVDITIDPLFGVASRTSMTIEMMRKIVQEFDELKREEE